MRVRACIASLGLATAVAIAPASIPQAIAAVRPAAQVTAYVQPVPMMMTNRRLIHRHVKKHVKHAAHKPAVHGPCPAFGTVLVSGAAWLSGGGVDVISNGGTGPTCYSMEAGHRWQCGELVNRFLAARRWGPQIAGVAADFYANADPGAFDQHPIGSGYLPVPGDIVVWSGGLAGYGHVAIVIADANGVLTTVQQNSSITGYGRLSMDPTGAIGPSGSLQPVGYLHAKANPLAAPTAPPTPTPTPTATPAHVGNPKGPGKHPSHGPKPNPVTSHPVTTAHPTSPAVPAPPPAVEPTPTAQTTPSDTPTIAVTPTIDPSSPSTVP